MLASRPYKRAFARRTEAGLRPTRQRVGLSRLLFEDGDRHVTAEQLHAEAMTGGLRVSLATVYNALHQMTDAGILREVVLQAGRSYFDTNITLHHHFFHEESGWLFDVPGSPTLLEALPPPPPGTQVKQVDVVIRLAGMPAEPEPLAK